jgi:hypothetical protein
MVMVNVPYPALSSPLCDEDELEQDKLKESAMNNKIANPTGTLVSGFHVLFIREILLLNN